MKNQNNLIVGLSAAVAGLAIGAVTEKVVSKKAPQFQPALIWVSGALVGSGLTVAVAPSLISKSEAASILASN